MMPDNQHSYLNALVLIPVGLNLEDEKLNWILSFFSFTKEGFFISLKSIELGGIKKILYFCISCIVLIFLLKF
jgi:hypothetical protein